MNLWKEYAGVSLILCASLINICSFNNINIIEKYDNLFLPPLWANLAWFFIGSSQIVFALYQIFVKRVQGLVKKSVLVPYLLNQVLLVLLVISCASENLFMCLLVSSYKFIVCVFLQLRIAYYFRNKSRHYTRIDYFMIELPFSLTLGWETVNTCMIWNTWFAQWSESMLAYAASYQLAFFIISLILITQASVLYAGLPQIMNPYTQLPILWFLLCLSYRWFNEKSDLTLSIALSTMVTAMFVTFYALLSCYITYRSEFYSKIGKSANNCSVNSSPISSMSLSNNI